MTVSATFHKRYEKKYLLPLESWESRSAIIKAHLSASFVRDKYDRPPAPTIVENIYFDSPDLNSFHDAIGRVENRKKLRLRAYNPQYNSYDILFFEVKRKAEGITSKCRIAFKRGWIGVFMTEGLFPREDLFSLNGHLSQKRVLRGLDELSYLLHECNYSPVIRTQYNREAYHHIDSENLRLTIDSDLEVEKLRDVTGLTATYLQKSKPDGKIVELKFTEEAELEKIRGLDEILSMPIHFSKYCYGIQASTPTSSVGELSL